MVKRIGRYLLFFAGLALIAGAVFTAETSLIEATGYEGLTAAGLGLVAAAGVSEILEDMEQ